MPGPLTMTKDQIRTGLAAGRRLTQEEWAHPSEILWVDELIAEGTAQATAWEYKDGFQCERRIVTPRAQGRRRSERMKFNINSQVRVKLTPLGRRIHREHHDDLIHFIMQRGGTGWKYHPPQEDADGWSTWQLWTLMAEFGSRIRNSTEIPFETEIDIIEPSAALVES